MTLFPDTQIAPQKPGRRGQAGGRARVVLARGRAGRNAGAGARANGGAGVRAGAGARIHKSFCREEFSAMPGWGSEKKEGAPAAGRPWARPAAVMTLAGRGGWPQPKKTR
jgi:hypothetical protein